MKRFKFNSEYLLFDTNSLYLYREKDIEQLPPSPVSKYKKSREDEPHHIHRDVLSISQLYRAPMALLPDKQGINIRSLWLNIAQACNLRCRYCFADGGTYGYDSHIMKRDVAFMAVERLFKTFSSSGPKVKIVFFGGEPLLNYKLIKETVLYARKLAADTAKDIQFHIITNGTILTPEIIDFLITNHISLQISLDGPKEINDRLRITDNGNGSYDKILQGIQLAQSKNISSISIRATITKYNTELSKLYRFFKSLGIDDIGMVPVQAQGNEPYALDKDDIKCIKSEYRKMADQILKDFCEEKIKDFGIFSKHIKKLMAGDKQVYFCGAGRNSITIDSRGDIYPCHRLINDAKLAAGSLKSMVSPFEIKPGPCTANPVDNIKKCQDCWARYFCGGGCRAAAFCVNGSPDQPVEEFCAMMKAEIETAIYIFYQLFQHVV